MTNASLLLHENLQQEIMLDVLLVLNVCDIPDLVEDPLLRTFSLEHANVAKQDVRDVQPVAHPGLA